MHTHERLWMYKGVHPANSGQKVWKKSMTVSFQHWFHTSLWDPLSFFKWRMFSVEGGREWVNSFFNQGNLHCSRKHLMWWETVQILEVHFVSSNPKTTPRWLSASVLVSSVCKMGTFNDTYLRRLRVAYTHPYRWGSRIMLDTWWQPSLAMVTSHQWCPSCSIASLCQIFTKSVK